METTGRVRPASGEGGRNAPRQGYLGRRSGPGTGFPSDLSPRAPPSPAVSTPPETPSVSSAELSHLSLSLFEEFGAGMGARKGGEEVSSQGGEVSPAPKPRSGPRGSPSATSSRDLLLVWGQNQHREKEMEALGLSPAAPRPRARRPGMASPLPGDTAEPQHRPDKTETEILDLKRPSFGWGQNQHTKRKRPWAPAAAAAPRPRALSIGVGKKYTLGILFY